MTINILKANGIKRAIATVAAVAALVSMAACGNSSSASGATSGSASGKVTKITVGVCPGPYGDMVDKVIAPLLKDDGYELKTKLFNDYVQPDKALASGSIQANLMQHINYLKKFTKDNNLDLTSLDMVVLSACETGLGEVQGEGVFGLQRGFKKAGAQSLLMSLWSVDDEATQRLMQAFYDAHYRRHLSKRASLNEAQRQLRTYGGGRFNHPRFWAAFVLLDALD